MAGYLAVLGFMAVASAWLFLKASNEQDEFAGLAGHGIVALACLLGIGLGLGKGHAWLWIAAGVGFVVNMVFLGRRIRQV